MKITIQNLGILKQADFEVGDLTVICGKNNTGKTYATYALYGFLKIWKHIIHIGIGSSEIEELIEQNAIKIDLDKIWKGRKKIVDKVCKRYSSVLYQIFASEEKKFNDSRFHLQTRDKMWNHSMAFSKTLTNKTYGNLKFQKESDSSILEVFLLREEAKGERPPLAILKERIDDQVKEILFKGMFPNVFIASAERTGVAIFRKDLDFARNRMLDELGAKQDLNPFEFLSKVYTSYALPVRENVDFVRNLEDVFKQDSYLKKEHPDILNKFADIIGGKYTVVRGSVYFSPKQGGKRLLMNESSSAVRSLLDVGFYLRHCAQKGDLFIIDEPELNLHPENQCRLARLFACLVNAGLKVFITTHSDYIVKEINTLLMLKQKKKHLTHIMDKYGYENNELLDADRVKVFIADKKPVLLEGKTRKTRIDTFVPAEINQELGIKLGSFDEVINRMNDTQNEIMLGGDE